MRDHADEAAGQRQALDAVDGEIEACRIKGAEALVEEEAVQPASSLGHRLAECEGEGQRGEEGLAARQGVGGPDNVVGEIEEVELALVVEPVPAGELEELLG